MFWLKEKIIQFKEYCRLKKEYKIKKKWAYSLNPANTKSNSRIYAEHQSKQWIVISGPDKGLFGTNNYPCIVKKIALDATTLEPVFEEDKTFYCPNFDHNTPCKKVDCMWNKANKEHFEEQERFHNALEELVNVGEKLNAARMHLFGHVK